MTPHIEIYIYLCAHHDVKDRPGTCPDVFANRSLNKYFPSDQPMTVVADENCIRCHTAIHCVRG